MPKIEISAADKRISWTFEKLIFHMINIRHAIKNVSEMLQKHFLATESFIVSATILFPYLKAQDLKVNSVFFPNLIRWFILGAPSDIQHQVVAREKIIVNS